jgi:hypothetical protein
MRSEVMNHLDARRDQVAPPGNDGITGRVINRLLQLSFLRRLASPAFHMINSTEPWMIGLPYLSGEHGLIASARALTKAYNDIGGLDIAWQGIKETGRAITQHDTMDFGGRIRDRLKGDDQRVIDDMTERGLIGRDAGMELTQLTNPDSNIVGRTLDRTDHVSRQMGQAIEAINRSTTALAAYRLAREKGLTHEQALERTAETLNDTMGDYGSWNAPPMFNHPIGRLALQFRKYGQRQYYLLGKMIGNSLKGENKLATAKSLGFLLGTHFIMAGALGMPTEPITVALNVANAMGLTKENSDTMQEAFRSTVAAHFGKTIGQVTSLGVPSYFGFDTNSRFGLQQLLGPFGAPKSNKPEDLFNYFGKWLAGSGVNMSMDYLSGMADVANGNWGDAAYKLAPLKVAADTARGVTNAMHAKVGPGGKTSGEQWTPVEAAIQAVGFRPTRIAEANAAKSVIYTQNQSYSKDRTAVAGKWIGANSPEDRAAAWDAVQRFNAQQTSPNARITMSDLYKQQRAARKAEAEARAKGLPAGARVNKRVPEIAERARATYNY